MKIKKFEPTYTRDDGLIVIYGKSIPLPKEYKQKYEESGIVIFPPGAKGGNHKHPRIEALYSPDNLTIIWVDKKGKRHKKSMAPKNGKYILFVTEPNEPHSVINNTKRDATLVEFAEVEQHEVKSVELI